MRIRDPGWRHSDPGWKKVGSGIRGKLSGSAILTKSHLDIGDEREFLHHILHDQPRLVLHVLLYLENPTNQCCGTETIYFGSNSVTILENFRFRCKVKT
jgi:hypothetical protein